MRTLWKVFWTTFATTIVTTLAVRVARAMADTSATPRRLKPVPLAANVPHRVPRG